MNKRIYSRHELKNIDVDISDGNGFYSGTIRNISRFGMQINDVSSRLDTSKNKFTVVVSAGMKTFKLSVLPRWILKEGSAIKIGVRIDYPPYEWTSFLMNLEDGPDDIWGHAR